ncbi:Poly [ADP-ribose] polymerase [Paramyrothecium foliicola]|nr:Poly [ADP-ribose] polymerase [Paramyrothecium foliicola]
MVMIHNSFIWDEIHRIRQMAQGFQSINAIQGCTRDVASLSWSFDAGPDTPSVRKEPWRAGAWKTDARPEPMVGPSPEPPPHSLHLHSSMRATRGAAAKAAEEQPDSILDGFTFAITGSFRDHGHDQSSLTKLIQSLGGKVTKTVAKSTTHLLCSDFAEYKSDCAKVTAAKSRDLPLLKPEWLLDSAKKSQTLPLEDPYLWTEKSGNDPADADVDPDTGKKRPIAVVSTDGGDEEDEVPKPKKTKAAPKANGKANAKKGSAKTKDEVKKEDEPEASQPPAEEKVVAEGQFIKKKGFEIPRDEFCPLQTFQVYIDPDSGMIYDAALNQSNSTNNNNKFYRIQILHEASSKTFKTWTRWGRVGEAGQNAILGNGTLPDAIKNFEKKFRDKSGLPWDKRNDDPKPGKYAFIERSYNPDSDDEDDAKPSKKDGVKEEEEADDYVPPECTLEEPVKELMELIFNQKYFQAAMASFNYDANKMPLGKLSKSAITRGFQQLKDLSALMGDPTLATTKWNRPVAQAIEDLSNTYYSVIPHAFGRNRPPIIRDETMLKKEVELLESLSDMKAAEDIMKVAKTRDSVHPLDRQFQGLNLSEMTVLDSKSKEFSMLSDYLNESRGQTHHVSYDIQQIFRIERDGEKARFDNSPFASIASDRRLLWHGSRATNFGGILSQGLRIAPPEACYMFGKGIYLADMSSKSAGYCCSYDSSGHALLLLCEAELGDPIQKLTNSSYTAGESAYKQNMWSTWGQGGTGPSKWIDAGAVHKSLKGIKMPDAKVPPGPTKIPNTCLYYNEYICYDVAQVRLRYLFRVKM